MGHAFFEEDYWCSTLDAANDGGIIHDAKSLHVVFTPATNSDKKKKKKQKKGQEKKLNHVIKGNTTCSNPSMWTTPHVQPLSYVSDGPPSLAQQVDQKLAIASGYSLTSFPSTSTFRRHCVCKSPCKGIFCSCFQNLCHFPCIFAIVNICESHE